MQKVLTYRPELNAFTGSPTATILVLQAWYRYEHNCKEPFYKFMQPAPSNPFYSGGDSWTEELGFTLSQLRTALKKVAQKLTQEDSIKDPAKFIYYRANSSRLIYWDLNEELCREAGVASKKLIVKIDNKEPIVKKDIVENDNKEPIVKKPIVEIDNNYLYTKSLLGTVENAEQDNDGFNPADDFDRLCEEGQKEKNCAKKETEHNPADGPVTPETARAREAMIKNLAGEPSSDNDPLPEATVELTPEDATEATLRLIETPEGARLLKFAMQSAQISDPAKLNLFDAIYRCAKHQKSSTGTIPENLLGKLPGYLRTQELIDKRARNSKIRNSQNKNHARSNNNAQRSSAANVLDRETTLAVAQELYNEHLGDNEQGRDGSPGAYTF